MVYTTAFSEVVWHFPEFTENISQDHFLVGLKWKWSCIAGAYRTIHSASRMCRFSMFREEIRQQCMNDMEMNLPVFTIRREVVSAFLTIQKLRNIGHYFLYSFNNLNNSNIDFCFRPKHPKYKLTRHIAATISDAQWNYWNQMLFTTRSGRGGLKQLNSAHAKRIALFPPKIALTNGSHHSRRGSRDLAGMFGKIVPRYTGT